MIGCANNFFILIGWSVWKWNESLESASKLLRSYLKSRELKKIIHFLCFFFAEIIARVIAHEDPPFRPVVKENACKAELQSLMTQCWDDDPDRRPHFNKILDRLRKVMGR